MNGLEVGGMDGAVAEQADVEEQIVAPAAGFLAQGANDSKAPRIRSKTG